ncbi:MAG: hypothetical protein H0V12_12510 [Chloroflexi bacterium]|nr:hypothetical protein [Chloroflexota bacterium]
MSKRLGRGVLARGAALIGALILLSAAILPTFADDDVLPPASSVGTGIPLTYQGPPPSEVDRNLVGPVKLLRAGEVDQDAMTVTLPLYRGELRNGRSVWYILTDTTDERNAEALGLNFSAKLNYAATGKAVRSGWLNEESTLIFDRGGVDFSPERRVVPGEAPNFFPPADFQPGSVGGRNYTPLVRIENGGGHIYNAPVVAFNVEADDIDFCEGDVDYGLVHDRVLSICPEGDRGGTVTLQMTPIFSFAKPTAYISTEASDPMVAALDAGTHAPALGDTVVGFDDGAFSAVERLFPIANGPTGADNPQRQGLNSALSDVGADGKPLPPVHVIGGLPTVALDYSPLWDLNLGEWTQEAIDNGYRSRLIDEFQLLAFVEQGWLTGPGGAPFGSTGIVVNCPIVIRFL